MKIVKEYNYKPNQYARILNKKSTNLIGVIAPDITNPYFPQIIQSISGVANEKGYQVILCTTNSAGNSELDYLEMLQDMRVNGTILLCPSDSITDLSAYEDQAIISIDSVINDKIPYVCSDFYKGGYIAAAKLIENDCKNILHVSGRKCYYANVQRRAGFDAAIKNSASDSIKFDTLEEISHGNAHTAISQYLDEHPDIDGIFADNDSFAFTVLHLLNEKKIKTPKQVKVIGYDDNYMIPMVYPLLSTIHQPITDVGICAANTLISMINQQQIMKKNILDVSYIKRNTTIV